VTARTAVEFKHVAKSFADRKVLIDVSFTVAAGEALCIMGRSGIGKSVTLKLMIGLLKPDSGQVYIESEDIVPVPEKELSRVRRNIGFLFQSAALFDCTTRNYCSWTNRAVGLIASPRVRSKTFSSG